MLQVAMRSSATAAAFETRRQQKALDSEFPLLLESDLVEPVELVDELADALVHNSAEKTTTSADADAVTADADIAGDEDEIALDREDAVVDDDSAVDDDADEENDSDYHPEDDASDAYESDDDEYRQSLETELDDDVDDVSDVYLARMLEERSRLEGDDAAWVDRYIEAQRLWKEQYGTSIDEINLDLHLAKKLKKKGKRGSSSMDASASLSAFDAAWHGRVSPLLPAALRKQPAEYVVSLVAVGVFVALALGIQFYVAFQAPLYK